MKEKLVSLLENSYSPYSKFRVSAIAVMNDGMEFSGVNVENASYGATICAERSAILSAISHGYKKGDFQEIHIMNSSSKIATPCFICRQVLIEFCSPDMPVYLYTKDKEEKHLLEELTPLVFNEDNL